MICLKEAGYINGRMEEATTASGKLGSDMGMESIGRRSRHMRGGLRRIDIMARVD